jgi:hypothetical protein
MKGDRVRLMLDFKNLDDMKAWFALIVRDGNLPKKYAIFRTDGLDFLKRGIPPGRCYIVKSAGDRPEAMRV